MVEIADNSENEVHPTGFLRTVTIVCLLLPLVVSVALFAKSLQYSLPCDPEPIFGVASTVILFGMCGLYFYAYKFYADGFYELVAVAWAGNGIYILLETFFLPGEDSLNHATKVLVVGALHSIPLYIASRIPRDAEIKYYDTIMPIAKWIIFVALGSLAGYLIAEVGPFQLGNGSRFFFVSIAGVIFSFRSLIRAGQSLKTRLSTEVHGPWATIFPVTFYIYAALQPAYPFMMYDGMRPVRYGLLTIALLLKIANSVCALKIIQLDFANAQRQLQQRSVLEDLGALTASIEHDIKNPLHVIDAELKEMRRTFQSKGEVLAFVQRIEEQRVRIFATTGIIPVIRGGRDYYEQFMERTSIADLINRSFKAVKAELSTHNILFKLDSKTLYTRCYPPMLQQAIVNVLRNSVEAIHEARRESGLVRVSVRAESENELRVDFWDNGCGIAKEVLPHVTKLFLTTRQRSKPNSGIGLFVSSRILRVHGGRLKVDSTLDEGTHVSVFIPQWRK